MRTHFVRSFGSVVAILGTLALLTAAEKPRPTQSDGITRQQADAILDELKQIRLLLERQQRAAAPAPAPQAPQVVNLKIPADAPILGSKDAPLTLVEFSDYECAYCRQFHLVTFPALKKNYIDTGKIRFYSRDLPLGFHSNAKKAALAARCAGEQGQFWAMRDELVTNANALAGGAIVKLAEGLHLDLGSFGKCLDSSKYNSDIASQGAEAAAIGIDGTPSFVLGVSTPDGVRGALLVGAHPYGVFEAEINKQSAR
jgi:protein-disulfide isomerase